MSSCVGFSQEKGKFVSMNEEELIEKIEAEFMAIINSSMLSKWITSNGSSGPNFHATLNTKNEVYKESQYYFNEEKKFVHWTSIQNLMSIINYRELRLYNLHKSSDSEEFNYAAKALNVSNNQIDHSKKFLYTFSFCKSTEINNNDLWSDYGKDYKGVALEFEIINDPKSWDNFMLANVYYEIPTQLEKFGSQINILKNKYSGIEANIDLGRLIAFHKQPNPYKKEKEIRLSTYFPFGGDIEAYWKHCNTEFILDKNRPRITDYSSLNLWTDNDSPYLKSKIENYDRRLILESEYFIRKPQIKLTNIHFGYDCGISNKEYYGFKQKLEEIIKRKLGYELRLPLNLFKLDS